MNDIDTMGPIDYLVIEFPGNRMTGEGVPLLVDLVERGIIRILDLAFIRKDTDGSVAAVAIEDVDGDGSPEFEVFQGASSGLIGQEELREAAEAIEPGNAAGVIIYENAWAGPLAAAWRRGGAQVVATGRIPVQALLAAAEAGA